MGPYAKSQVWSNQKKEPFSEDSLWRIRESNADACGQHPDLRLQRNVRALDPPDLQSGCSDQLNQDNTPKKKSLLTKTLCGD